MKKKNKTLWSVLIAILLAIIVGTWTGTSSALFGISFYSLYDLIGTLFIHALTLVVVPLVSASITTGIAKIGNDSSFGRLGLKIFGFYLSTSLLAILIGLLFVNLFSPGTSAAAQSAVLSQAPLQEGLAPHAAVDLRSVILQIIPSNVLDAFSKGQMLGLIFFSILFGYAVSKIGSASTTVLSFAQGIFETMIKITHLVMKCLPIGVFCLVAKVFATTGLDSLRPLGLFVIAVVGGLAVYTFVALPLLLKGIGKIRPLLHFRAMSPALITAFSTSSSSASLPITIDCVEKGAGVSNRICSLVVPLGTSMNMAGSALYECVAAMFIAQAYGIDLSFTTQFLMVFLSLIMSMGVAGIPGGSLVAIIVILNAMGLPIEGLGILLAVDRLLDMCRTTVNVFSDSCCAVLVASSEGEKLYRRGTHNA